MPRPTQAINFKRIGTPSYRTYRVLQARGDWGQLYRSRVADHGDYRGAIIFPEQLFGISHSPIYVVRATSGSSSGQPHGTRTLSLMITPVSDIGLYDSVNHRRLTQSEHVLEYEEQHYTRLGLDSLLLVGPTSLPRHEDLRFANCEAIFTSKDQACRWLEKRALNSIRKLVP